MAELLATAVSWPSLLLLVMVFGFAPGFCLRLIVLAYPHTDPRRTELIAELYAVPRSQRPLWVAEQLEVALFEGLAHRATVALRRQSVLSKRSLLVPVAAATTLMLTAFAGVSLAAMDAQPGDQLFSVTKVLYSDYARWLETSLRVEPERDVEPELYKVRRLCFVSSEPVGHRPQRTVCQSR